MNRHVLHAVIVDHSPSWRKWPDTQDTDYTPILSSPVVRVHKLDEDTEIQVIGHYYPAFLPYIRSGHLQLPKELPLPWQIDCRYPPHPCVLEQQLKDLTRLCQDNHIIIWRHGWQAFPPVTQELPRLFHLRLLEFGDDCPGSSEYKTFPHAKFFNALIYNMYTWDFDTGTRVKDKYAAHGIDFAAFGALGMSSALEYYIRDTGFSVTDKANQILQGKPPKKWLSFVGCVGGMNPKRAEFSRKLDRAAKTYHRQIFLRGIGWSDGELQPHGDSRGDGYIVGPIYRDTLFGLNYPISSIWNTRAFDLFNMGVVPVVYDKNHEMADFGFIPGEHFIPFNGTVKDCLQACEDMSSKQNDIYNMLLKAKDRSDWMLEKFSISNAYTSVYKEYKELILK
jgi:hypothetical protein